MRAGDFLSLGHGGRGGFLSATYRGERKYEQPFQAEGGSKREEEEEKKGSRVRAFVTLWAPSNDPFLSKHSSPSSAKRALFPSWLSFFFLSGYIFASWPMVTRFRSCPFSTS